MVGPPEAGLAQTVVSRRVGRRPSVGLLLSPVPWRRQAVLAVGGLGRILPGAQHIVLGQLRGDSVSEDLFPPYTAWFGQVLIDGEWCTFVLGNDREEARARFRARRELYQRECRLVRETTRYELESDD